MPPSSDLLSIKWYQRQQFSWIWECGWQYSHGGPGVLVDISRHVFKSQFRAGPIANMNSTPVSETEVGTGIAPIKQACRCAHVRNSYGFATRYEQVRCLILLRLSQMQYVFLLLLYLLLQVLCQMLFNTHYVHLSASSHVRHCQILKLLDGMKFNWP